MPEIYTLIIKIATLRKTRYIKMIFIFQIIYDYMEYMGLKRQTDIFIKYSLFSLIFYHDLSIL